MKSAIISVGNELLRGEVLDTNAHWLCQKLLDLGLPVYQRWTVPDQKDAIAAAIHAALRTETPLILIVGGLGPTVDDLTRNGIAQALDLPLKLDEQAFIELREKFAKFGLDMPAQNKQQVEFPEGAEVLGNPWGSAPAFLVQFQAARLVAFPGVPKEMKRIFENLLTPRLKEWFPEAKPTFKLVLRTFGIGESTLEDRVRDLLPQLPPDASWSSLPRDRGNCDLIITAHNPTPATIEACKTLYGHLQERLGRLVFTVQPELELDDVLHQMLIESNLTLALAESCTGGMATALLVSHAGSSKYLERGWITYSNRAKIEELGVLSETLGKHGAVSEETALEMARGARIQAQANIGVSVTGIAGPGGGTTDKPVGLVYIAVSAPWGEKVYRRVMPGDRNQIRSRAADSVLHALRLLLLERPTD